MNTRTARLMTAAIMLVAVLGFSLPAFAQQYTGRIEVTVFDATGGVLPGVIVEVTGPLNQTVVTDARGEARFLNLTVGTYQVHATLQGFTEYRNTNVPVAAGVAVPLQIKLAVAGAQETIFVTAQSPVIDTKKQGTQTNVGLDELQNIPTARDPWVVMQTVPGIVMDRVNVGGSESGQQAGFMSKGATSGDTTWNIDGMPITDMSSLSSPFYFDFDAFQEMSVTTGGADAKSATGGVQLNMMLKSGTNSYHGNVKGYFENEGLQWTNMDPALAASLGSKTGSGDRTDQFTDWGGDIGGPILKDRWWAWGAYGKQDIRIIKTAGAHDRTVLKNASLKTQAQFTKSLRGSFTFFQADKLKWGRNADAFHTQPSTVDQSGVGGPNQFYKAEVNYVIGNNVFLVGRYAHVRGGFQLIPEGGINTPAWVDAGGVWQDSQSTYITSRPQDTINADANFFKGAHEIKVGFAWRKASVHSTSTWANGWYTDTYAANAGYPIFSGTGEYPYMSVAVNADYASDVSAKYYDFYAGDTITLSRMTINLGLRYDRQVASVLPSVEPAPSDPWIASVLPAITAPGIDNALTFGIWQPRVGLTYAVDEARKTQLRATYAMFTSQSGAGAAGFLSVATYRGFYMDAYDANGDHIAQGSELIQSSYAEHIDNGDYWGYDPTNPNAVPKSINTVGDYTTPRTHEIILGVDHELMPNFGVSASFTWRRIMDFNWRPVMSSSSSDGYINGADYVQLGTVNGTLPTGIPGSPEGSYAVPYYAVAPGTTWDPAKGGVYSVRPDYHQSYKGFEITATKRMSNRWMARLGFSVNSWREYFDSINGQGDPTQTLGSPNINGGYVVNAAGGSGKSSIYMTQPKYQIIANGMYQLPHNIDLGASYNIRQGYPMPWNYSTTGGFKDPLGSTKRLLLPSDFGWARMSGAGTLDVRVGYALHARTATFNFDFDLFNLMNSSTILGREYRVTSSKYTQIAEIMQPRIARIGLRINF